MTHNDEDTALETLAITSFTSIVLSGLVTFYTLGMYSLRSTIAKKLGFLCYTDWQGAMQI